ncbi:ParB-like nuclease domain-containing protein [Nocardia transvalensis]|uniref:ParB-like nuclease domain-containing protein n=1 Tax=Nocardia transvalensis TaxID=37333 RepID=UPI001893B3B1|nr:ParB-like nuclease domain-containing protein [Nocardia transvalensis]MBF6330404.1 ParB-like nuclease domain-containing protein [Nocardia transvalensis]
MHSDNHVRVLIDPDESSDDRSVAREWLASVATVPVEMVPVHTIRSGPALRMDERRSAEHIRLLTESTDPLPPLIVHRFTMTLIDGAHRLCVARARGQAVVPVQFFDGTEADAYALAVQVNVTHGLPLSVTERKAAAARLISTHPHWSDRLIAITTGLSHKTVGVERRRVTGDSSQLHARTGKDGKVRPLVAAEGRRIAAEIIRDNPTASLREISSIAGISTGTVRDVRARLSRGEDPVPTRGEPKHIDSPPQSPRLSDDSDETTVEVERNAPVPEVPVLPKRTVTVPIQSAILQTLQSDPALRFNVKGRAILRLVRNTISETGAAEQVLLDAPSHCHGSLAKLARANAQFWNDLANRLENQ